MDVFRYENEGTADSLIVTGTTLTNLPRTKSLTGTAFYQTVLVKCFDLPATNEIWIKFDVYFDGINRWRAFNGGDISSPYNVGVTAQTNANLSLVQNSAIIQNTANVCKKNQLQTVLLHMVTGAESGVIEAWVDGTKIYRYTGDVNHGEDFADIYLQSDGAGTFFSNVIISNAEIYLCEGRQNLSFDVETYLRNAQKGWRVYNPGETELLDTTGATTVEVPYTQSVTGKAFYGGTFSDMFHTPAGLKEIWIRCDFVHKSLGQSKGIYVGHWNSSASTIEGISGYFSAYEKITNVYFKNATILQATAGQLYKMLLHIKSGAADGLIEVTIDKNTYTYRGNVNGGNDLNNLVVRSQYEGQLFSNVVVSETELTLDDGWHRDSFGVETKINAPVLNVRLQGSNVKFPLSTKRKSNSLTIRVGDRNFYNTSVATSSTLAGAARYLLDDKARALSSATT